MLVGHAGDIENDAGGCWRASVKCVNFARKCCKLQHFTCPDEKLKLEDDWPESIFPQVLIQLRKHLFTSLRRRGDAQCHISSSYFPLELRRAISHESGLRKLHCSRLLRASCSLQAAARKVQVALRKCSEQVALRKGSAPVAPCKRFAHVLCASWSVQVALRKCFVQLLCASCSAQVALRK